MALIEEIIGKTVTEIKATDIFGAVKITSYAFYERTNLTSVSLPETVKEIGSSAFSYCSALTRIDSRAVEKIGNSAFDYCTKLTSVPFLETVKEIGSFAFNSCEALRSINLRVVEKIEAGTFEYCKNLTSVSLPETLKEIGSSAFWTCEALRSIDLRAAEKIASGAFSYCTKLATVNTASLPEICNIQAQSFKDTPWLNALPNGLNLLGNGKIAFYAKGVTSIVIPASVRTISIGAFDEVAVPSIVVPDTVVRIWGNAFNNSATTKVTIGAGVQIMGKGTMGNNNITTWICRQPTNMILDIPKEAGQDKGLAYYKDSRSFTLYTDNEMLKAYNWAGDNVTATIKPLSEAPA